MTKKVFTLCLVCEPSRILLGMKKHGLGTGRWNGFGGKVKDGETIEKAMRRETREEAGIEVSMAEKVGVIDFEFSKEGATGNQGDVLEVHIFRAMDFTGEPRESDEMKPKWFDIYEIPYDFMWPDDKYWVPLFLEGKKFRGKFLFGEGDSVLEHSLEIVGTL